MGFLPFSPLGRGFLTGTVHAGPLRREDFRARNPRFTDEAMTANTAPSSSTCGPSPARYDATAAQVALAWLLSLGEHVLPDPGDQEGALPEENAAAADLVLTDQDLADARRSARAGGGALLAAASEHGHSAEDAPLKPSRSSSSRSPEVEARDRRRAC